MKMAKTNRENSFVRTFYLYWRFRENHPWNIEEFRERPRAYNRFFNLLERGIEARFQTQPVSAEQQLMQSRFDETQTACVASN